MSATNIRSDAPAFGLEMLSHAPNPADRAWVPLMRGVYTRYRFASSTEAEEFRGLFEQLHRHMTLRVVRLD